MYVFDKNLRSHSPPEIWNRYIITLYNCITLETHLPLLTLNEHTCIYYSRVYTIA